MLTNKFLKVGEASISVGMRNESAHKVDKSWIIDDDEGVDCDIVSSINKYKATKTIFERGTNAVANNEQRLKDSCDGSFHTDKQSKRSEN